MDGLAQAAGWLRDLLSRQAWLDGAQPIIAHAPDWVLLAAGPAILSVLALMLRLIWPKPRPTAAKTKPQLAPKPSRQAKPAPVRVAVAPALKAAPSASRSSPKPIAAVSPPPAPRAGDDEDNRSVRVFVSSTFLDMKSERNELVTNVFPALRAKYRARGVEVFEVDLRWGITREQQERGETLPTLLAEIDRCRPYFIGLLGDRYGWVPPAAALTDKLKADYPVLAEAGGASVTAIEIMHGVLANPDAAARACFFERDPNWDWRATLDDADRAAASEEPEAARAKLADLKATIRQKTRVEAYARPAEIGEKVTAALDALLEARFPETDAPDAFQQTARLHRAYARERRSLYVGADAYFAELNRWMAADAAPKLITGASGGGKSTLVSNWINAWRLAHPNDIIFEHYLGASPDSAEPMLVMRRLWEHLNRTTGESADPPGDNAELMDVSAALAQRLAQVRSNAERKGARVLIALDGLDKLASKQNLRWLPITPGVHWLVSSLPGEASTAALTRGFLPLEVKPLSERERQEFIAGTLARWRRKLEPQHIARILQPAAAELAGLPLYLKTVLEELRISADNARLAERLEDYRGARRMPDLFDRVLKRLEDDCELGLAVKALPLIWASRAGLEETELLAVTGASPLAWATLRNGLGDGLRDQQGRIAFGHDYLNQAVAARYLKTDEQKRSAHLAIADRFEARAPDARQAEELPYQLRTVGAWDRLEALLVDLDRFMLLRQRGDGELLSYWLPLKERGYDPEELLCKAFDARADEAVLWTEDDVDLAFELTKFLDFAGALGRARSLLQHRLATACENLFGVDGSRTSTGLNNLAVLLNTTNRHAEAEPLYRRALAIDEKTYGPDHPNVATPLNNLALLLAETNHHSEAEPLYRRALAIVEKSYGPDHPRVATGLNNLAALLTATNRQSEAEPLYRRAVAINEKTFGPNHPRVATFIANLADLLNHTNRHAEAEPLYRRALAIDEASFGPDHPDVARDLNNLAGLLHHTNRHSEAEPLYRRALAIDEICFGPDHPHVASDFNNLASLLHHTNRHADAELLYRRALAIDEASFGPDHPDVARDLNNLAGLLENTNRHGEAEPLYRRALTLNEQSLGPDHPRVASGLSNLGGLLAATNRHAEAEPLYRRALAINEASFGPDHPDVAPVLNNIANLFAATNRHAEAEPLYRRALAIVEKSYGPDHPRLASGLNNLAALLKDTNHWGEAERLYRRALVIHEQSFGSDHVDVAIGLTNLASLLYARSHYSEAEPLMRRALVIYEGTFGSDHPNVATALNNLASVLAATNRHAEAEPLYRRALAVDERRFGSEHPNVATDLNNIALLLAGTNRYAEAEALTRRALAIDEASFGYDHPNVATGLVALAKLLAATNRHSEAEPLYRRALAIVEKSYGPDHPRVASGLNNLASLLHATNRHAEAEPLYRRALAIDEQSLDPDHPDLAITLNNLAALIHDANRPADAEPFYRRAVGIMERCLGSDHPDTMALANNLALARADIEAERGR